MEDNSPRVYNSDRTDVDMERFAEKVCEPPRKRSCFGMILILLLVGIAAYLYLAWGGKLPWT